MNSKTEFLENISSPENDHSKCSVFEICRNEKFSIQNLTFWNFFFQIFIVQENFASESEYFFSENFVSNSHFQWKKYATKSCFLKWARKVKNLLLASKQIESKRLFLDVNFSSKPDFSIKIEFKNWVSGKYFFPRKWLFEMFCIRNLPERKILNSKPDISEFFFSNFHCAGKFCFRIWILFLWKFHFKLSFSMKKVCYKVMLFKMSTQSEKLVVGLEANRVKTFFFRCEFFIETWFLNKNWIQKLSFWKIFLPQKMIIRNVLYSKSAGTKNSQFKTWHFGIFSFQIFIVREKVCFRIWFLFFCKILFKLWFSMKKFATKSCLLKWARKVKNLLLAAEQIESQRFFSDVKLSSKPDLSIKIEFKNWVSGKYFFPRKW